jgi:hypothetical protein
VLAGELCWPVAGCRVMKLCSCVAGWCYVAHLSSVNCLCRAKCVILRVYSRFCIDAVPCSGAWICPQQQQLTGGFAMVCAGGIKPCAVPAG